VTPAPWRACATRSGSPPASTLRCSCAAPRAPARSWWPALAGYEIRLPALAERRSDVGRLLVHFLELELEKLGHGGLAAARAADGRPFPPASLVARLALYDWPGNVRQLANVARRLAIACHTGGAIALEPFIESLLAGSGDSDPAVVSSPAVPVPDARTSPAGSPTVLYQLIEGCPRVRKAADLGREEIEDAVARGGGDLEAVAAALEVSVQGLKLRMKTLGLR